MCIFEQTKRTMKKITFLLATCVIVIACQPKAAEVVVEETVDEASAPISTEEVVAGESVYSTKCSKCHDAPVVKDVSPEKWEKVLTPMIKKAELSAEEEVQVRAFISYQQAQ